MAMGNNPVKEIQGSDQNPLVTVVTPVLNEASTIRRCADSVSEQSYRNIEHIVIDGGSEDGTCDIAAAAGARVFSEPDAGIYDAFNKGVARANGEIIHILNADDYYAHPGAVANVVEHMKRTGAGICHGLVEQIDRYGRVVKTVGGDFNRRQLLRKMRVAHPATFVRADVYQDYGSYSVGFRIAADHEFLLRVWDKVKVVFLDDVLVRMQLGGVSDLHIERSYRESMAAALINGQGVVRGAARYYWELLKAAIKRR